MEMNIREKDIEGELKNAIIEGKGIIYWNYGSIF